MFGTVTVDVDVSDVFSQLADDELRNELEERNKLARKKSPTTTPIGEFKDDFAEEALAALKQGRFDHAMLILERGLRPKFESIKAVKEAYARAMAEKIGAVEVAA